MTGGNARGRTGRTVVGDEGIQHAVSLGNITISGKTTPTYLSGRSYDSEDEYIGRRHHPRPRSYTTTGIFPKPSIYSKCDIREQYCLSDRQLTSIERPRREKLFGCWSGHSSSSPQSSFLGVCVGRRAPSDENLAYYAPFYKYPRYPNAKPVTQSNDAQRYDENVDNYYFRRRPTSFLSSAGGSGSSTAGRYSNDVATRYAWMPEDEESVRLERPRPICADEYAEDIQQGRSQQYIVGSGSAYPPSVTYLSQSSDHINGIYPCPTHYNNGLPIPPPPPPPSLLDPNARIKHVSFARSHTLASFDNPANLRSSMRLLNSSGGASTTKSQERLLGGKKPSITLCPPTPIQKQRPSNILDPTVPSILSTTINSADITGNIITTVCPRIHPMLDTHLTDPNLFVFENLQRNVMKTTQATQTEVLKRNLLNNHHLTLSPRTIHRVKMVSQGAQTNGGLNGGRKLTKSLSEAATIRNLNQATVVATTTITNNNNDINKNENLPQTKSIFEHEPLHRTQSEEPPRSPFEKDIVGGYSIKCQIPASIHSTPITYREDQLNKQFINKTSNTVVNKCPEIYSGSQHPTMITNIVSNQNIPIQQNPHVHGHSHHHFHHHHHHHHHSQQQQLLQKQILNSQSSPSIIQQQQHHPHPQLKQLIKQPLKDVQNIEINNSSNNSSNTYAEINELQKGTPAIERHYESNSLPRRKCMYAKEEFFTYSLPRKDRQQAEPEEEEEEEEAAQVGVINHHTKQALIHPPNNIDSEFTLYENCILVKTIHHQQENLHKRRFSQGILDNIIAYKRPSLYQNTSNENQQPKQQHQLILSTSQLSQKHHEIDQQLKDIDQSATTAVVQSSDGEENADDDDDVCSTCEIENKLLLSLQSESDDIIDNNHSNNNNNNEQEIIIDFKPKLPSPLNTITTNTNNTTTAYSSLESTTSSVSKCISSISGKKSPLAKKKILLKTHSEGEILINTKSDFIDNRLPMGSSSEGDLKTPGDDDDDKQIINHGEYIYKNDPIKDEGICDNKDLLKIPGTTDSIDGWRNKRREAFRKRSISLDEPGVIDDDGGCGTAAYGDPEDEQIKHQQKQPLITKSKPSSPQNDMVLLVEKSSSSYPSSDSLANDFIKDNSDEIWNESQLTVLHAEFGQTDIIGGSSTLSLLTPTSKRKNLLLQHQQRSSIDTEALDIEDDHLLFEQSLPLPPPPPQSQHQHRKGQENTITVNVDSSPSKLIKPPAIAVIPSTVNQSDCIGQEDDECQNHQQSIDSNNAINTRSDSLSPVRRNELRKNSLNNQQQQHQHSDQSLDSMEHHIYSNVELPYQQMSSELMLNRSDSGKTNTDNSECSTNTNTEDYVTCTDSSRKQIIIKPLSASSSSTQIPVSAQTSQTITTQDGSSFESASSMYSLVRGDAICDDTGVGLIQSTIPHHQVPSKSPTPPPPPSSLSAAAASPGHPIIDDNNINYLQFPDTNYQSNNNKKSPSHSISSTSSSSFSLNTKCNKKKIPINHHQIMINQKPSTLAGRDSQTHNHPSSKISSTPMTSSVGSGISSTSNKSGKHQCHHLTTTAVPGATAAASSTSSTSSSASQKEPTTTTTIQKKKSDSFSEDDKSEKRYSSSGYYESPHHHHHHQHHHHQHHQANNDPTDNNKHTRIQIRRITSATTRTSVTDWNNINHQEEEQRRKRKEKMRLDIEKENMKSLTSPIKKTPPPSATSPPLTNQQSFKQISPDDRTAMNILDGTSPNKTKRFRPKTKRITRSRSDRTDEIIPKRSKTPINITTVADDPTNLVLLDGPSKQNNESIIYINNNNTTNNNGNNSTVELSPRRKKGISSDMQLNTISTESLRSVSPGSDSVFYSEIDGIPIEKQVHCQHCGKDIEIISACDTVTETIIIGPAVAIVKPPADFADSPDSSTKGPTATTSTILPIANTIQYPISTSSTTVVSSAATATSHGIRLYKKLDKRFRSEERHAIDGRRHYRYRHESTRAKSEERGTDESNKTKVLRPAGSSPCVGQPADQDQECSSSFKNLHQEQPLMGETEHGVYHGSYRFGTWICIPIKELRKRQNVLADERTREMLERKNSTDSEKDFRKKYQAITHRLVHRKSCLEMYRRQKCNSFKLLSPIPVTQSNQISLRSQLEEIMKLLLMIWAKEGIAIETVSGHKCDTDKTIVVRRQSGEFGFRIHGSKPVVVSAIEPETPAESSGLEVGDIVLSVNGISVIDKMHSDVVKLAHAGSDTLELDVARTISLVTCDNFESSSSSLFSGYLWRQTGYVSGNLRNQQRWVRRFFILRPDHCLYYYKNDTENQPVGAILLTEHTIEHCSTDIGRPYAFRILSTECIPLYLAADSEELANSWINITRHASKESDPWLEISTQQLNLPANAIQKPDCYGYLMKMGSKWRTWSKRYCILKDACLYFYHDGNSKSAFGMACLQGYRVQVTSITSGKKFVFEITPPETRLRHYCLSTETEMDKKRWVAALEFSIDRWMKVF